MINARALMKDVERILAARHRVNIKDASCDMLNDALGEAVMLTIGGQWTRDGRTREKCRQAHYLSAEYLTGRLVYNNLYCMGLLNDVKELLSEKGVDITILEDAEDAALGNGGLGRLAACFLDSAAAHALPLNGYGLRYRYGLFRQKFTGGAQTELPDDWTRAGDPWSVRRDELSYIVHMATGDVRAVAYDMPVIGYNCASIGTLRLWHVESLNEFDFRLFNDYKYKEACADKNAAEDITKVLYPNDWDAEGKRLRLKQQYVLSSASMQDILATYERKHGMNYRYFDKENAIQLNDTHPVLAIPEFIRLLTMRGKKFAHAVKYAKRVFAYTNHTVMPEALEKWDAEMIASIQPEILNILKRIDKTCKKETGLSIIKDKSVSMADLAIYMGAHVNGVAKLHTELLKRDLFADWHAFSPEKFINVTNGITQRRWLGLCNPELCEIVKKRVGDDFMTNLEELKKLNIDDDLVSEFMSVKLIKKRQLAEYIEKRENINIDTSFIFDAQVKRLHEYKRQLMNALSLYDLYMELKSGKLCDLPKIAFIFGAKAAPGYVRAKAIIRYINALADKINSDTDVNGRMRVCFVENYNCSYAEKIIPAADFSEQISPAGTEASGTGNMKFMLNGAVTIGTFDGANIEITEAAGRENEVIFGADIAEIDTIKATYDPMSIYESEPRVKRAVDSLAGDDELDELRTSLLKGASWHKPDHYFVLYDFMAYQKARINAYIECAKDPRGFARKCLENVKHAGVFSSDRTVLEYSNNIWNITPIKRAK